MSDAARAATAPCTGCGLPIRILADDTTPSGFMYPGGTTIVRHADGRLLVVCGAPRCAGDFCAACDR